MASGRMLKKEMSNSRKLGNVKTDRARVVYFMMFPHLDVMGRLDADVKRIKGQITTMLPYSEKSIQACLEQLHEAHLVTLYVNCEQQYLEYARFDDFQNLNPAREAESSILGSTHKDSRVLQRTPLKLSKVKLREVKTKVKFKAPTLEQVQKYISEKGYDVDAKKFMDYFTESGWVDSNNKPVRNWKQKIITWSGRSGTRKQSDSTGRDFKNQQSEYGQTV